MIGGMPVSDWVRGYEAMVPHLAFISILLKVMQIVLKGRRFLGEGFPQRQKGELDCEKTQVLPDVSETVPSNLSFLFVVWGTTGNGEPVLLFPLLKQSQRACGLQNALLPGH